MKSIFSKRKPCVPRIGDGHSQANGARQIGRQLTSLKALSLYALQHRLMVIAYYITRLYFLTVRVEAVNEEAVRRHLQDGKKLIAALWHQRIIAVIGYAKGFGSYQPSVMISRSRDGEMVADLFSRMNFRPVRGSSSRGGKQALAALVDDLKDHPFAVHILDGPKGPRGMVKPGLLVMARESGAPVVPVYASVSRAWVLNSWDRCLVPKPFSKIVIRWDDPIDIPREMDENTFEETRARVETHMQENQRREDRRFGWPALI